MFEGFPSESMRWFDEVVGLDDWAAVQARRAEHDRWIRQPMVALCTELADEFGAPYIWRLHRSRWFWAHQHAQIQIADTIELGVTLSGDGLQINGGWLRSSPDQVRRFRVAVDAPAGKELAEAIADAETAGFSMGGLRLARVPRGFTADHPRAELLLHRTLTAEQGWPADGWLATREALDRVRAGWRALDPLTGWLAEFVGWRESRM
ncbi:MAG TPA: DUF2461 family protein [Actinomycetes bacterium]|nr:DUF2461 family protein [Actinomycetes bacterium]